MKVLHVISGISKQSGGPSRSSQGMVSALCKAGIDAWIYSFDGSEPWIDGVRRCAELKLEDFDLVHLHGIWDLRLHRVAVACRKAGIKYVIAPRGMLEPWSLKQKWLKKFIARLMYQDRDLHGAAALHATAESEAEQFRRLGFKNEIIISPNGVNVPEGEIGDNRTNERRALFVSRMHPKKGVMELVESWSKIKSDGWKCELVYTMNGDFERDYESRVKARVRELGLGDKIIFTGPLDDAKKWEAYARANLFVLPTYSENFGIVVAEALWAGVPVITTKGTPWKDLEDNGCGWWIDVGEKALTASLADVLMTPTERLSEMGKLGHELVAKKYTWPAVVAPIIEGYKNLVRCVDIG